jgi:transcription initiation factor TFIID TATA-box-binding protein
MPKKAKKKKKPVKAKKKPAKKAAKKKPAKKKTAKKTPSKKKSMQYTIVNLVASANLNATLDLYNLAITIPNIEYEPEQFPGAILKLREPKVSMLLFKNGKVICSGAASEKEIELGIKKASKLIHDIQRSVKVLKKVEYNVVNLVATANLNMNLDLFSLAMGLDNVEYEPEQFPGAILRIHDPKITLLLFKNGKVICAGAKREALLKQGLEKAVKIIRKLKRSRR